MAHQRVLDPDARDPFAAGFDHVLFAIRDRDVALAVDAHDVAGAEPTVSREAILPIVAVVRSGDPRAAHLERLVVEDRDAEGARHDQFQHLELQSFRSRDCTLPPTRWLRQAFPIALEQGTTEPGEPLHVMKNLVPQAVRRQRAHRIRFGGRRSLAAARAFTRSHIDARTPSHAPERCTLSG